MKIKNCFVRSSFFYSYLINFLISNSFFFSCNFHFKSITAKLNLMQCLQAITGVQSDMLKFFLQLHKSDPHVAQQ